MEYRPLGTTGMSVSAVAMGCWPIAGMTSAGVTDQDSLATIRACFELGVNHLDTAFMYGTEGQSERLIAQAIAGRREEMVLATKGGLHWDSGDRAHDARPETLRRQCEESLRRLGTEQVDLYYLHAPDPNVPVAESAGELRRLLEEGKTRSVGASNCTVQELESFSAECPLAAYQPPYNMLQRAIEAHSLPWCAERGIAVLVYWPLLKGLLAGGLRRQSVLPPGDSRLKYPMFHGQEWQKNHDLLDELRQIAAETGHTVAQLVINWTIHRPGITSALCGAKQPDQLRDNAGAAGWSLDQSQLDRIDQALGRRGPANVEPPV